MNNKQFMYKAYGLTFAADFCIPGLPESQGLPDVIIRYSAVPESLEDAIITAIVFQVAPAKFLLNVEGIARYLIVGRHEIIIEPCATADETDVQAFLLGTVLGVLLQARGGFVLHGAAVNINGQALIATGVSAVGKSTLAAALCRQGHELLADDMCLVSFDGKGKPELISGYPLVKLWTDAVEVLGEKTSLLRRVRNRLEKYQVPVGKKVSGAAVPLRWCVELRRDNSKQVSIAKLPDAEKVTSIETNAHRYWFLSGRDQVHQAKCCKQIAAAVNGFRMSWPLEGFWLEDMVKKIEGVIDK
ncbi:MAG: HPr kinase [Firmicutes bacterium]|nr:HPr kinase [Bacillota bacterium]